MQALAVQRRITPRSGIANASSPFGKYGPMERHEVRQPNVQGTELERLRQRREMLLSMDPEKAKTVIEWHQSLTFFEAVALAKREGRIIVPNIVHDRILTETTDKGFLKQAYREWKWTGTLVIYEKPDKRFGKKVTFRWKDNNDNIKYSVSFNVPEKFRGLANCALIIDYPDFDLMDLGNNKHEIKLVDGANIHLIGGFPTKSGWHKPHPETMIPHDEEIAGSKKARHLWRQDGAYIGCVARSYGGFAGFGDGSQSVTLVIMPSYGYEVALF